MAGLLGEVRELARQLGGGPSGTSGPSGRTPAWTATGSAEELGRELSAYRDEVMVRQEWPVVAEAWRLAAAGQSRGLVELDRAWGQGSASGGCGEASQRVGRRQLNRLRPLRDVRVVQRYLDAINSGEASGWHPVVFGVWLAVFGIPLRQGLVHYAEQTLGGLLEAVPASAALPADVRAHLHRELSGALPERLAVFLPASGTPLLAVA